MWLHALAGKTEKKKAKKKAKKKKKQRNKESKPIKTPFLIQREYEGDPVGNDGNYGN